MHFGFERGLVDALTLLRVYLRVRQCTVDGVSLVGCPQLIDKEDGGIEYRLINFKCLATLLFERSLTAFEERIAQCRDVLGLNLADDVHQLGKCNWTE